MDNFRMPITGKQQNKQTNKKNQTDVFDYVEKNFMTIGEKCGKKPTWHTYNTN